MDLGRGRSLGCLLALLSVMEACTGSEVPRDARDLGANADVRASGDGNANRDSNANADVITGSDAGDQGSHDLGGTGNDGADLAAEKPANLDVGGDSAADRAPTSDARDVAPEAVTTSDARDAAPEAATTSDARDAAAEGVPNNDASDTAGEPGAERANDAPSADATDAASDGGAHEAGDSQGEVPADAASEAQPDAAPPAAVSVATHDLGVDSKGTVFNVADDYFNDGFIPPTPVANFGIHSQIIAVPNDDGSLDVAWLDYANGKSAPWALPAPGPINITHVNAALTAATTTASGISSYKLLGFTKDPSGNVYLAYNKDHPFKTSTNGDENHVNGNELHVAKLNGTVVVWDRLIFGDQDNNLEATLGDPGGAATGILGYDATNNRIALYLGHSMMWFSPTAPPTRHQAGFFRLLTPDGTIVPPAGNDVVHFGSGWFYSHSFNQRLIIDAGNYYVLAHGDAYPRQLGFAKWSLAGYTTQNDTDFDQPYFAVAGNLGDNKTDAQTGQFVRMNDGRFLIVHTSSQGRSARDVRLVFSDGTTGKSADSAALWLTSNQGTVQATMPKVERLGNDVIVTYALWDTTVKHQLTWYVAALDQALNVVAAPRTMTNVEFVDSAPLFRFNGGPNAGAVGWVSGNSSHTLSVHVASLGH